jgi:hypothetical protein
VKRQEKNLPLPLVAVAVAVVVVAVAVVVALSLVVGIIAIPRTSRAVALLFPLVGARAFLALRRISLCEKYAKSRDLLISALSLALGRKSTTSHILSL